MAGQWFIEESSTARAGETVERLKTHLEELEIFVREVVQNSLDAGLGKNRDGSERPVTVDFRIRNLTGEEKADFLSPLDPETYLEEMRDSARYEAYRSSNRKSSRPLPRTLNDEAIDAFDIEKPAVPLRLLIIEDRGTVGLTGEDLDYGEASRFCACCRDSDFSVRESGGRSRRSGGSYGKGKNVLWKHASSRLVLFYSVLSEPWQGEHSRFIGVGKLPWHADWEEKKNRRSGRCFFGGDEEGNSILGPEAASLAKEFGLERSPEETGTSICLVGFQPLGTYVEEEESTAFSLAAEIINIVETWYWPAIFESRLQVRCVDEANGERTEADPFNRSDLKPFLDAWEAVQEDGGDRTRSRELSLQVPRGPGDAPAAEGFYQIGCTLLDEATWGKTEPPQRTPGPDSVALVRGFGMVVEYREIAPRGIRAQKYAGVCRAGMAVEGHDSEGQERLEALLSSAEPPAHDRWNPVELPTSEWRGAQARVKDLLKKISQVVTEVASSEEPAVPGETLPELSRLFRMSPEKGSPPRTNRLSITRTGEPTRSETGEVEFSTRISTLAAEPDTDSQELVVRLMAEILDPGAGPVQGVRGESGRISRVLLLPERHPVSGRVTGRRNEFIFRIPLRDRPLPIEFLCVAVPPTELAGSPLHLSLQCKAALEAATTDV